MKKLLFTLAIVLAATTAAAQSATFTVGNYNYKLLDGQTVAVAKGMNLSGDIVIPSSVTYENVTYTVTQIMGYAFESSVITGVTIPASIDSIGDRAFGSCGSLANVTISDSEKVLKLKNGYYGTFAYSGAEKTVYVGRDLWRNQDDPVFDNATSVVFGDKVTFINKQMFQNHSNLATITIGSGVKTIESSAFSGSGTAEGVAEQVVIMGSSVEMIEGSAFADCSHLKSITLPETLKNINGYAFSNTGLTAVTIPVSVDSIGDRAFGSCADLASIRINDSEKVLKLKNGYYGTFAYSSAEKTVYMGRDIERNENNPVFGDNATSVEFGDKVTVINRALFYQNSKLTNIKIGKSVKIIEQYAFSGTGTDESIDEQKVTMGSAVTLIVGSAFENCSHLKSITLPETLKNINGYAFSSTGLTAVTIPISVDSIGQRAFGSCGDLASIRINDSEKVLKLNNGYYGTFAYSSGEKTVYIGRNIERNENNTVFSDNVTGVEFGNKVTVINSYMFNTTSKLASIKIGSGVKTIEQHAFSSTGTDETITEQVVTMGSAVTLIEASAFESCSHLKSITLPETLKNINGYAFSSTGLTAVTIPVSVDSIGDRAFGSCADLAAIRIPDSEKVLKLRTGYYGTFAYSDAEKTVYVGRNIWRNENSSVFSKVTGVEFGPTMTNIATYLLSGSTALANVKAQWLQPFDIDENVFAKAVYETATLWIPNGTLQAYKAANGWKNFINVDYAFFNVSLQATKNGTITAGALTASNSTASALFDRETDVAVVIKADEGYELKQLTVNGTAVQPANGIYTISNLLADQAVVATFGPIDYTISYSLAGGGLPADKANPATYTIETETFTLVNPVRDGYTFEGWTGTGLEQATVTVTIAKGSTGDRSYTATWKENAPEPGPEPTLAQGILAVEQLADMNTPRISHQILPTDDGFAVFGGHTTGFSMTKTAERYNSATGTWTQMNMPNYHDYSGSIVLSDGQLLLIGGMSSNLGVGASNKCDIYNPETNEFAETGNLVQPRSMCFADMTDNGNIYLMGCWYNSSYSVECYNQETKTFTRAADGFNANMPYVFAMRNERVVIINESRMVLVENGNQTELQNDLLKEYPARKSCLEARMADHEVAKYSKILVGYSTNKKQAILMNVYDDPTEGIKVRKIADLPMTLPNDEDTEIEYMIERTRIFCKPADNKIFIQTHVNGNRKRPIIVEYTYPKADKIDDGKSVVYIVPEALPVSVDVAAWTTLPDGSFISAGGTKNNDSRENYNAVANTYVYKLVGGVYCDVNGDGSVDVADIATIISVMAGSSQEYKASADVNGDGNVDVADIGTVITRMSELARLQRLPIGEE